MTDDTLTVDRRVRRTRDALRSALLTLLSERSWDAISVQDLCDRANIGRSTFYMHFQSKEQLLEEGFDDLRLFVRGAGGVGAATPFGFLTGLIDHVVEQQRIFRSMIGSHGGHAVRIRFREMLLKLINEDPALDALTGWQRDLKARLLTGALLELLTWLAEARRTIPPLEVEETFRNAARAILRGD